jgi:quinol monooxygenase YgiN
MASQVISVSVAYVIAAALALGLVGLPAARAQDAPAAYVVSYIETMPAKERQAVQLIDRYGETARAAAGNLQFEALQRIDRPNQFALLTVWKDQKAAEAYAASDATKQFHDKLQALLIAPQDDRPSTALDVGKMASPHAGKNAVYVVTHVDLIPPKKDDGIAAIKQVIAPSRSEAGNLRFDVLQQNSRPNHFTVVEIWRNRASLEAHETAEHTRKLRDLLLPMGGALYDQRLYHSLD